MQVESLGHVVLRVRDLPRLAAASDGRLADPTARPADQ